MMKFVLTTMLMALPVLSVNAATLDCVKLATETIDQLVDEGLVLSAEQYQLRARIVSTSLCEAAQKSTQASQASREPENAQAVQNSPVDELPTRPVSRGPRNR